ncbi:MAG: thiamine pyrophosphate-dependent enzyme [Candidatus Thermoplasmatota archaeon]|nr:thiamine pyrophosphate-dependent enzyme [Candidatus Thermoplasmatota archaeon]
MIQGKGHPKDAFLRSERLPHIWCPGCGIGIVLNAYLNALALSGIPREEVVLISGIGCTARLPGYANADSYHTTHGRSIAFATGMKIANPKLHISLISGDGDLFNIGGNHIMHAARRNIDLNVICVNNFNYGMTGGQHGSTTPAGSVTASSPYGNLEQSFNLPYMMKAMGASYVSRWTALHVRQLTRSIAKSFTVRGFSFIEVLSVCPPNFGKDNGFADAYAQMQYFREHCEIDNNADLHNAGVTFSGDRPIILGDFYHKTRPTFHDIEREIIERVRVDR